MSNKPTPHSLALSRTLILLREIKGVSLREHARMLGLSSATLCRLEQGKSCDVDTLMQVHKASGVKLDTLLGVGSAESQEVVQK